VSGWWKSTGGVQAAELAERVETRPFESEKLEEGQVDPIVLHLNPLLEKFLG
jgi:hypothetical protein